MWPIFVDPVSVSYGAGRGHEFPRWEGRICMDFFLVLKKRLEWSKCHAHD